MYSSFEGIPGCGKTTQSMLLFERIKEEFSQKEVVLTREPGGDQIAIAIRTLVQATKFDVDMDPVCEAYLYAAARAQSLRTVVAPILKRGGIVFSDRTEDTSVVNQGFGRGMGAEAIWGINAVAVGNLRPELTFLIDLDFETALGRAHDYEGDKFELLGKDFFDRVATGYLWLAQARGERFVVIDGRGDVKSIHEQIYPIFKDRYTNRT